MTTLPKTVSNETRSPQIQTVRDEESPSSNAQEKPRPPSLRNRGDGPPNGGLTAWLQVVGGFLIFFNTWQVQEQLKKILILTDLLGAL